jgi:hypothetical protein
MTALIGVLGGMIGFIIAALKSTLFFGGDALICGIGNWFANVLTGILGGIGTFSWVTAGSYLMDFINMMIGGGGGIINLLGVIVNAIMGWG